MNIRDEIIQSLNQCDILDVADMDGTEYFIVMKAGVLYRLNSNILLDYGVDAGIVAEGTPPV